MKRTLTILFTTIALTACGGSSGGGGGSATGGGSTGSGITTTGTTSGATIVTDPDTPPAITFMHPAPAADDAPISTVVTVSFSKMMDPSTISSGFSFETDAGAPVMGDTGATGAGIVFVPASDLAPGTTYRVRLTTSLKDIHGNALTSAFDWSFTTGTTADTEKPTVSYAVPAPEASGVSIGDDIIIGFSEPMNPATIEGAVTLSTGSTLIPVTATLDADGYTARITPDKPLDYGTLHAFSIDGRAEDLSGNPLESPHASEFVTKNDVTRAVVGSSGNDYIATAMMPDSRGNIHMAFLGTANSFDSGTDSSMVIASLDPHLRLRWATPVPYTGAYTKAKMLVGPDGASYLLFDPDGEVTGDATGFSSYHTPVIIAVEPDGVVRYVKRHTFGSFNLTIGGADLSSDGATIAIAATTSGTLPGQTNAGGTDIAVLTVNAATGALVNTTQYGTTGADTAEGIAFNTGAIGVIGYVEGSFDTSYTAPKDILLSELSANLSTRVYDKQTGYSGDNQDILAFSDGGEAGLYALARKNHDLTTTFIAYGSMGELTSGTTGYTIDDTFIASRPAETDGGVVVAVNDADNVSFIGWRTGEYFRTTMHPAEVSGLSSLYPGFVGYDHHGNILFGVSLNAVFDEFPAWLTPKGGEDLVIFKRNPDGLSVE